MCMGVATANSILVVSFATEQMREGKDAIAAALEAGYTRFRPVLMTALAMIIGMVPMALGLGEGGEQNAPLGRAVIGGLMFATVATLLFVPTLFSLMHGIRRGAAKPNQMNFQSPNKKVEKLWRWISDTEKQRDRSKLAPRTSAQASEFRVHTLDRCDGCTRWWRGR